MSDQNHICHICSDGKNSGEFAVCSECFNNLKNGMVGFKCSACGKHRFSVMDERNRQRVFRMLILWADHVPGICSHKLDAIMKTIIDEIGQKAIFIYFPSCPNCYKTGVGEGCDPAHPQTIAKYKVACFSIKEFYAHQMGGEEFYTGNGPRIIH